MSIEQSHKWAYEISTAWNSRLHCTMVHSRIIIDNDILIDNIASWKSRHKIGNQFFFGGIKYQIYCTDQLLAWAVLWPNNPIFGNAGCAVKIRLSVL